MLTKRTIEACVPLAEIIDSKNVLAEPLPGTPLFNAVAGMNLFQNLNTLNAKSEWVPLGGGHHFMGKANEDENSYYPNIDEIVTVANYLPENENVTLHDLAIENTANFVADAIKGHLYTFRNVVVPIIGEFTTKVETYMEEGPKSPLLDMVVQTWAPPAILENSAFQNELSEFKGSFFPSEVIGKLPVLPDFDTDSLKEALKTGSNQLDGLIDNWINEAGITKITSIFQSVFRDMVSPVTVIRSQDETEAVHVALTVFLIARKAYDNPVKGIERSLADYNSIMADYRNYAGDWLNSAIDGYDDHIKKGLLVRKINGNVTSVYKDVYDNWLSNGGEIDILYGNMLEKTPYFYLHQLNEAGAHLKETWNRHERIVKASLANRRHDFFVSVLYRVFNEIVKEHQNTGNTPIKVDDGSYNTLKEVIRVACEADITRPNAIIREIVCKSFFGNTDANQFLADMENASRVNPDLDAREAGFIATVKYVCRWVTSQIRFNKM